MSTPPPTPEKTQEAFTYSSAVSKGERMHALTLQDSCASSTYLQQSDLAPWGWSRSTLPYDFISISNDIRKLITACAHSSGGTRDDLHATVGTSDMHDEDVTVNGVEYPSTMAHIFSTLNPKAGLFIAQVNTTPENMLSQAERKSNTSKIPELKRWSDVAFLQWKDLSVDGVVPNLKFVGRVFIHNDITRTVLKTVLANIRRKKSVGDEHLPQWPGVTFTMESDEGKALLGTPNGSGVAWLLAQHKKELGHKIVDRVRLWYEGKGPANLLFHLKDMEKLEVKDSPTEDCQL
jgi:hypothetical protein